MNNKYRGSTDKIVLYIIYCYAKLHLSGCLMCIVLMLENPFSYLTPMFKKKTPLYLHVQKKTVSEKYTFVFCSVS